VEFQLAARKKGTIKGENPQSPTCRNHSRDLMSTGGEQKNTVTCLCREGPIRWNREKGRKRQDSG